MREQASGGEGGGGGGSSSRGDKSVQALEEAYNEHLSSMYTTEPRHPKRGLTVDFVARTVCLSFHLNVHASSAEMQPESHWGSQSEDS